MVFWAVQEPGGHGATRASPTTWPSFLGRLPEVKGSYWTAEWRRSNGQHTKGTSSPVTEGQPNTTFSVDANKSIPEKFGSVFASQNMHSVGSTGRCWGAHECNFEILLYLEFITIAVWLAVWSVYKVVTLTWKVWFTGIHVEKVQKEMFGFRPMFFSLHWPKHIWMCLIASCGKEEPFENPSYMTALNLLLW